MTIQVEINPEIGARLAAQARVQGVPLEWAVAQGKDLAGVDFYLCPVCGNIDTGQAPPPTVRFGAPKGRHS
jgi:hypothetical protein